MKNSILTKILALLICASVCFSGTISVWAFDTKYYVEEDFGDYATNGSPAANITVAAKKGYIAENEAKNDKYLVLEGTDQLVQADFTLSSDMDNLFISFDMERTAGNKTSNIAIKSGRGSFTAATISEMGDIMTYNGKVVGSVSSKNLTNIAFSFNQKYSRYSIYIDGEVVARDFWVGTNFPSGKILGFSVSTLLNGEGSIKLDNVYCYQAEKLIDSNKHPKKEYSDKVQQVVFEEEVEEENTSVRKMSNFDGEASITDELGTTFQMYPRENVIEKITDGREGNKCVRMYRNTTSECFVDLYVGNGLEKVSIQFDLRSTLLSQAYFQSSSMENVKAAIMDMNSGGILTSGGLQIGKLEKRQWTNLTICIDNKNKVVRFYVDGELAGENKDIIPSNVDNIGTLRMQLTGSGESDLLIDNLVIYNGAQYVNYGSMLRGVIDENLYIYNLKTKTVESVLEDFNAINIKSGFVSINGEMDVLEELPQTDGSDIMLNKSMALKLVGVQTEEKSGDEIVSLKELAEQNGKILTFTNTDTVFVGDTTAVLTKEKLLAVNSQLTYVRPEKEMFAGLIKNEHPRVILNKEKLAEIKANFGVNEYVTKWGNDIIAEADKKLKYPHLEFYEGQILNETREMTERIMLFAMAYLLTEDEKYFTRCWETTEALCNFKDWDQDGHALDSSMAILGPSICYDWLYDKLTDKQKELIVRKCYEYQMEPAYKTYHQAMVQNHTWATVDNNWNAQCNGYIMVAACAMFEENPEMYADILKNAMRCLENVINMFYPSGAWHEGPGYWAGTVTPLAACIQTLENTFGTDFNLSLAPLLDKTTEFIISTTGTEGANNYNDGSPTVATVPVMYYFADKYNNDGFAQVRLYDMLQKRTAGSVLDLCYFNPKTDLSKIETPLDTFYSGVEIASMHSSYTDPTGAYVSFHSGNNLEGAYHAHIDSGTFVMDMLGERFVCDLGSESYTAPGVDQIKTQSSKDAITRWSYYKLSAEGHNTLLINPDDTSGQNIVTDDKIEVTESKPKGGFAITSLSSAYEGYAKNVRRGIMLADERRSITIRDEIELNDGDNEVWWFMHTDKKTNFEFLDNNTFTMELNGKKVKGIVLTNASTYELKEMEAEQLYREVPPQQSDAKLLNKKLGIKMNATGNLYIQVKFVPYDDYYATQPAQNIALDDWSIPDGELVERPVANSMTVDGKVYENFDSVNVSYELSVPFGITQMPEVAMSADAGIVTELVHKAQDVDDTTQIRVYDKNNPNDYRTYYISFKSDMSTLNDYIITPKSIEVSDVPQPENPAEAAIDMNLSTRWSSDGDGKWLILDLGQSQTIDHIGIAFMSGDARQGIYQLYISDDKENWEMIFDGKSSGTTADIELTGKIGKKARYVKFVGYGNTANEWNSVTEIAAYKLK